MKNIGRRLKQLVIALVVLVVLGAVAYGSHWATVAYAESRDKETITSLRKQVNSNDASIAKQTAKVAETLQYLNENNIDFTTEASADTLIIRIVGDRAVHRIKDGEDIFVLNDTTNDPMIKEK